MNSIQTRLMRLPSSRAALAILTALVAVLAFASTAMADSASLSVTNTSGQSDPVGDVPRIFTVSGTAAVSEELFVKYRATGGASCAPTAESDSGDELGDNFNYERVNGSFSVQEALTFSPGTYMFCIWLAPDSYSVTTPITQTLTFRRPTGTITATINPITPEPGQRATVTITGASEAPKHVYGTVRHAGGQCAPTHNADTGSDLVDGESVNGSFSLPETFTEDQAGSYVLCLWLADGSDDASPIAGPQAEPFTVGSPPPPPPPVTCRVPKFSRTTTLATIEQRLHRTHCAVGAISRVHSKKVKKGRVVRLSPSSMSILPAHSGVNIAVSSGPRHRRRHH